MDITIFPGKLHGDIEAIASKSHAHRLLICAAFADKPTELYLKHINQDILATVECLNRLGAIISRTDYGYHVKPASNIPATATLPCGESGSTLRFLIPIVGALGVDATFIMEGRLPQRPLSPLQEEMERMGCTISRPTDNTLRCTGKLMAGTYKIDGSVSSQFITGLLLASSVMDKPCSVEITGKLESAPYVDITYHVLRSFSIDVDRLGQSKLISPGRINVEGDWSNAAFFLAANKLGSHINIHNLNTDSPQGDRAINNILTILDSSPVIDCTDIPDLVPILAVTAAALNGATFTGVRRLRLKESDRIAAVCAMIGSLGGNAEASEDTLKISPSQIVGGIVNSFSDHRIAMAAAIAATVAQQPVTILNAQCVRKSYPGFWEDFALLGGRYEQHIR